VKLNTLLFINAIVALAYGLSLVVVPTLVLDLYGITSGSSEQLLARFYGVALLAFGLITWLAKDTTDPVTQRAFITTHLISEPLGTIVSILGILNGTVNRLGWSAVAIYVLLGLGYAYFSIAKPTAD
jgi:hypothetical protein